MFTTFCLSLAFLPLTCHSSALFSPGPLHTVVRLPFFVFVFVFDFVFVFVFVFDFDFVSVSVYVFVSVFCLCSTLVHFTQWSDCLPAIHCPKIVSLFQTQQNSISSECQTQVWFLHTVIVSLDLIWSDAREPLFSVGSIKRPFSFVVTFTSKSPQ